MNQEAQTLTLGPSARIEDAEELALKMRDLLAGQDSVSLDLHAVEAVDVSFFQLLMAFQRSLGEQNRKLTVLPVPDDHAVIQTAQLLGLPLEFYVQFSEVE